MFPCLRFFLSDEPHGNGCVLWFLPPKTPPLLTLSLEVFLGIGPSGQLSPIGLLQPYFCWSEAMYLVRLRIRSCIEPSLVVPIDAKIEPQTGMSLEP